jgi:putative MFS transporter
VSFAVLTSLALIVLGIVITHGASGLLIGVLVILLLVGINGSYAMVSVYAAEVFPTVVRGRGTGLIAAATKTGGLVGPQLVALVLVLGGGVTVTAVLVAVPLFVAGLIIWLKGVETRGRSLGDIQMAMH